MNEDEFRHVCSLELIRVHQVVKLMGYLNGKEQTQPLAAATLSTKEGFDVHCLRNCEMGLLSQCALIITFE